MTAKLIKRDGNFYSLKVDGIVMATSNGKLSKQNCDEIFGVVDVEKLANDSFDKKFCKDSMQIGLYDVGFEDGFNKAMELNKDKVFTLEDMEKCFNAEMDGWVSFRAYMEDFQQPAEMNVEIEMDILNEYDQPKLDSEGCLILKKI